MLIAYLPLICYFTDTLLPLQEKRSQFPRFYFIGDDDLLEILGQSTNPEVIQTHLKKLFAGIHSVQFDDGCKHILAMKSVAGEVVPLKRQMQITPEVEVWLSRLCDEMQATLQELLRECLADSKKGSRGGLDPNKYPSQVGLINSSPPGQNGCLFADDVFRCIFLNEKICILIKNSPKVVPRVQLTITQHWFR